MSFARRLQGIGLPKLRMSIPNQPLLRHHSNNSTSHISLSSRRPLNLKMASNSAVRRVKGVHSLRTLGLLQTALCAISICLSPIRASMATAQLFSTAVSSNCANISSLSPTLELCNGIEKSVYDSREYLPFTLPNGLRCVVVSDAQTHTCAAALNVHVGSFSDPDNVAGLAHCVEHCLFLGTRKHPQENGFAEFLSTHGGGSNAYTSSEDTLYYYNIMDNKDGSTAGGGEVFEQSLEMFSWFFKRDGPLFANSSIQREVNAIENEHSKNIHNDGFRFYQVRSHSC
jgi:hypothetical protein